MKVCPECGGCFDDAVEFCADGCNADLQEQRRGDRGLIAGYELEYLLESTARSETYFARQIECGQPCRIEILHADDERFLREAKTAVTLFNPNIADIYEAGSLPGGELFVVSEFPGGRTLREVLDTEGTPELLISVEIVSQTADALHALHKSGLMHRAVRPENIVLTTDDEDRLLVKIQNIDFGGVEQRSIVSNKFTIDSAIDSLRYFAPEQCSGEDATAQTDVYGLGIVFYEMLTGEPPFDAPKASGLIEKHRSQRPPDIRIADFNLRMLITHALTESLQKRPASRQATADLFARQMRHIEQLATHVSTPPPAGVVPPAPARSAVRQAVSLSEPAGESDRLTACRTAKPRKIEWNEPEDDIPSLDEVLEVLAKEQPEQTPVLQVQPEIVTDVPVAMEPERIEISLPEKVISPPVEVIVEKGPALSSPEPVVAEVTSNTLILESAEESFASESEAESESRTLTRDAESKSYAFTREAALSDAQDEVAAEIPETIHVAEAQPAVTAKAVTLAAAEAKREVAAKAAAVTATFTTPKIGRGFRMKLSEQMVTVPLPLPVSKPPRPRPAEPAYFPTIIGERAKGKTADADLRDPLFAAYSDPPPARLSTGRRVAAVGCGLVMLIVLFLFGGDAVSTYVQGERPFTPIDTMPIVQQQPAAPADLSPRLNGKTVPSPQRDDVDAADERRSTMRASKPARNNDPKPATDNVSPKTDRPSATTSGVISVTKRPPITEPLTAKKPPTSGQTRPRIVEDPKP